MRLSYRSVVLLLVAFLAIGALTPLAALQAQSNGITLSIAMPNFGADVFNDQFMKEIESRLPGIKVNIVRDDSSIPAITGGVDKHFEALGKYAASADLLFVDSRRIMLTPAATRAGYFLDLAPLAGTDKALNVDDFYPSVWKSFQWDKGLWALPTATDFYILTYLPGAFDKAGLAYPSEKWTLDDIATAATKLTQKDAAGKVTTTGLGVAPNVAVLSLLQSLLGDNLFDANAVPNVPKIDSPALEKLLNTYIQLEKDGFISGGQGANDAPMTISTMSNYARQPLVNADQRRAGILLPGGKAGLTTQGFAISAGTRYPDQAYALASFLTSRSEAVDRFSIMPARKSLAGTTSGGNAPGGRGGGPGGGPGGPGAIRNLLTPEVRAFMDKALANGLPASDARFTDYLNLALQKMRNESLDAHAALQAVEAQAVADLKVADAQKPKNTIAVATPVPVAVLKPGQIAIKFAMSSFITPLPNQDRWDKVIKDFISNDAQVGRIDMDTNPRFGALNTITDNFDCFFLPNNAVPNTDLGLLIALDPFIGADKTFDKSDVVGSVMSQLQRDNKTWALPVAIEPGILRYNSDKFAKSRVAAPGVSWTIDAFRDTIKALKIEPTDPPPFIATNSNGTHLLLLIAAYGGLPLDYQTNPVTIDFTSQKTVDAIRQALDLAKQGYIRYDALAALGFDGGRPDRNATIYTDTLNVNNQRQFGPNASSNVVDPYKPTTYPKGGQVAAVTYNISTAYISAKAQNPEACYRWISTLSRHPELFSVMPARHSLINDATFQATVGPDLVALYKELDKLLSNSTTMVVPALNAGGQAAIGFLIQRWLYEAFDKYVLNDGDLDPALKEAEGYAKGFQQCTAKIAPYDPGKQTLQDYNRQYAECAVKVDARLKTLFGRFFQ